MTKIAGKNQERIARRQVDKFAGQNDAGQQLQESVEAILDHLINESKVGERIPS